MEPMQEELTVEELAALDAEPLTADEVEEGTLLDADSDVVNEVSASDVKVQEAVVELAGVARRSQQGKGMVGIPTVGELTGEVPYNSVLPVLSLGDEGYASLAIRCLGMGDGTVFDARVSNRVLELQKRLRLEPTGTMTPEVWAVVLPVLELGSRGPAVMVARAAVKLPGRPVVDQELLDACGTDRVERAAWLRLLTS